MKTIVVFGAFLVSLVSFAADMRTPINQADINMTTARTVIDLVLNQKDCEAVAQYFSAPFKENSLERPQGANGLDGFKLLQNMMKELPKTISAEIIKTEAIGNKVNVYVMRYEDKAKNPNNVDFGVEIFFFDSSGKIDAHTDIFQKLPPHRIKDISLDL